MDFWPALFWLNRRAVLWVESVPSPAKSKILSEIKVRMEHFYVFATNFCTSGFLSFCWITICSLGYIHLDADAKWEPVCVQRAAAGQSINMVPCPPPLCFQTDYNQNKFLWGMSERIMDNFLLSRKSHSLLRVSPAALRTSRCGKTRAAKESVWIGTRTAGSVITTWLLLRVKAAPSKCPPWASVGHTSSVRSVTHN